MSFQTPLTIKEIIEGIEEKKYLMPAIQREFVWKEKQIEELFDSLMKGYPIGSFLFWNIDDKNKDDYCFYEFIKNYHERDRKHNIKADIESLSNIQAILDGQQRMTSLLIGLKGSYSVKLPRKSWSNNKAFPLKHLYLDLTPKDKDKLFVFKFTTKEIANNNKYLFKISNILKFEELSDINDYIQDIYYGDAKELYVQISKNITKLYDVICRTHLINYFLEKGNDLDKVLNIFIRVNSAGTILSYSDLLLSIATAQWKSKDARELVNDFVDEINDIGNGFDFNKDFVLKSCLVLSDISDIAFKVKNFTTENMKVIEGRWEDIVYAVYLSIELINVFGFSKEFLSSANAMIPIAYYFFKNKFDDSFINSKNYAENRKNIFTWLTSSLLARAFSGTPDNILRPIRKIIQESADNEFPLDAIRDKFRGTNKTIVFNDEALDSLLELQHQKPLSFSVLALLYPHLDFRNHFHQDHIFPKKIFKKDNLDKFPFPDLKKEFYLKRHNTIQNLQLLEGRENCSKSSKDFKIWLHETYPDKISRHNYLERNYIPTDISLEFTDFAGFIERRKSLMKKKLREIIG
jgi:uncharacterized protein with ParB-like and HNH nuclease domain